MLPRSLTCALSILVGCVALIGSAGCTAESEDDGASSSEDALSQKSNTLVLSVANTASEDTLDLDVGLSPGTARRIVDTRPFTTIGALRAVVTNAELKLLLLYGQSQPMYADGGTHSDGGVYPDAGPYGYSDGGYSDGSTDARADAYTDASPDASTDARSDAYADAGTDAR